MQESEQSEVGILSKASEGEGGLQGRHIYINIYIYAGSLREGTIRLCDKST